MPKAQVIFEPSTCTNNKEDNNNTYSTPILQDPVEGSWLEWESWKCEGSPVFVRFRNCDLPQSNSLPCLGHREEQGATCGKPSFLRFTSIRVHSFESMRLIVGRVKSPHGTYF